MMNVDCNLNQKQIIENLKDILSKEDNIVSAFLYGSFLYDKKYNDIDLGIFTNQKQKKSELLDYEFELNEKLSHNIKKNKFDVRIIDNAPSSFLFNVFQGKCLFMKDDTITDKMELVTHKELDKQYYRDQFYHFLIQGLKEELKC